MTESNVFKTVARRSTARLPAGFFSQLRNAEQRAAALRERVAEPSSASDIVLEALIELDAAQEELRVAEEHLQSQADELARSQEPISFQRAHYRDLFEAAPEAYLVTDERGVILEANQRASELFNGGDAYLKNRPLATLVWKDDRAAFHAAQTAALADRVASRFELRLQPRDLPTVTATLSASVSRAAGGSVRALRWLIRDLESGGDSEQDQRMAALQAELAATKHELEENRCLVEHCLRREQELHTELQREQHTRQRILLSVAHEIRNPLSSISGWLQTLQGDQSHASLKLPAFSSPLSSLTRTVRGLMRLADNLVDSVQVDERKQPDATPTSLTALVQQVVSQHVASAAQRDVRLSVNIGLDEVIVSGVPSRLKQVFECLLSNALRFTPSGGAVLVAVSRDLRYAKVIVSDTGCGIEPALLPHVFEPFGPPSTARPQGGLGLGLYLARHCVQLHGGTLTVSSLGRDRGTVATVRLPVI